MDKYDKMTEILNLLNRFMYRYRMANAFQTIVAVDVEKRTVDGYACGMKLFMAYSAYDELREAEKNLINGEWLKTHKLKNKELAERIRKNTKMKNVECNKDIDQVEFVTFVLLSKSCTAYVF